MMLKKSKNFSARSSPKPLVLVDFDETLINTGKLKEKLFGFIDRLKDPAAKAELAAAFRPFDKQKCRALARSAHPESRAAFTFYNSLFAKPREYNFHGAEEFLRELRRARTMWLLTYGYPPLQRKKLQQSGLSSYFDRVIFTEERSKEKELRKIAKRHPGAAVLDDEPYVCTLAEYLGFRALQIKKGSKNLIYYRRLLKQITDT